MVRALWLVCIAGCGRIAFDEPATRVDAAVDTVDEQVGQWRSTTEIPHARRHGCAVALDDRIYSIGGLDNAIMPMADVVVGQVGDGGLVDTWTALTPLSTPTWWHSCAVDAATRTIFVVGGDAGAVGSDAVLRASVEADGTIGAWTAERALPLGVRGLGAYVAGGRLCAAGGESADGFVLQNEVWCSTIASDRSLGAWMAATPLPASDYVFGMVASGGTVFVTGGYIQTTGVFVGPTFSATTSLPTPRQRHASVALDGYLYVIAGQTAFNSANLATVERAPISTTVGAWESLADLPASLKYANAVAVQNRIYLIGGADDDSIDVATVFVMTPN